MGTLQGRFLTTGYRWLNPFILTQLRLSQRLPQLKSVVKPIFVIGTGRSGSTILGKVLSMHRDIGFLNEPKAMWYTLDAREDVNGHFQRGVGQYRFDTAVATAKTRQAAHRLFGFYLTLTGSKRVLDKNPEIVFRLPFVRTIFPDAKFIFLVRNGWDTIHSITTWSKTNGRQVDDERQDWWGVEQRKWHLMVEQLVSTEPLLSQMQTEVGALSREEAMAAVEWIVTMQEGIRALQTMPEHIYCLHYEALTQEPRSTALALQTFCELPHDEIFLKYAVQALTPNIPKEPITLAPILQKAFVETMVKLNYPIGHIV